jgi:hypothetical protein
MAEKKPITLAEFEAKKRAAEQAARDQARAELASMQPLSPWASDVERCRRADERVRLMSVAYDIKPNTTDPNGYSRGDLQRMFGTPPDPEAA